jgi:hypothetical protein
VYVRFESVLRHCLCTCSRWASKGESPILRVVDKKGNAKEAVVGPSRRGDSGGPDLNRPDRFVE